MSVPKNVLEEVLTLKPVQKAELIDRLLSSLDEPDEKIQQAWIQEVEDRIEAFEDGRLKVATLEKVLEKYK